jgi:magnesium chelatase family protein
VTIVRGQQVMAFPTRFMLVAAANPCPCGLQGSRCSCTPPDLVRYRRRLSGPLLDRIDIFLRVERPRADALRRQIAPRSAEVAGRVVAARERQVARLAGHPETCNAQLTSRQIREVGNVTPSALRLLSELYDRHTLSARGHTRILRVARTVADLEESDVVGPEHVDVAASLRLDDSPPLAEAA